MTIALIAIFFAGIANFALHRAMVESDDPVVIAALKPFRDKLGPYATYSVEFLFLVSALTITGQSWFLGLIIYGIYTALNFAAFSMIQNRPR